MINGPAFENILVYLDGSRAGEAILPFVARIASHFDSKVVLLHVLAVPSVFEVPGKLEIEPVNSEEPACSEDANSYMNMIAEVWRKQGMNIECVTVEGAVDESILAYAKKFDISLIALAVNGHGILSRIITARLIDKISMKSGIPALTFCPEHLSVVRRSSLTDTEQGRTQIDLERI